MDRQTKRISRKTGREACEMPDDAFFGKVANAMRTSRKVAQETLLHSMLQAYWRIGALVSRTVRQNPGQEEAVLEEVSRALAGEFASTSGRGFSVPFLRMMQRLHKLFPDPEKLSAQLSWSHYLILMDWKMRGQGNGISKRLSPVPGLSRSLSGTLPKICMIAFMKRALKA